MLLFFRLAAAQVELDAVMATLKEKQDSLAAVEEKVPVYKTIGCETKILSSDYLWLTVVVVLAFHFLSISP